MAERLYVIRFYDALLLLEADKLYIIGGSGGGRR